MPLQLLCAIKLVPFAAIIQYNNVMDGAVVLVAFVRKDE